MESKESLEFTGNWFIDAGILGFVNLMEEVYGWESEDLEKMITNEPQKVYYGYFPFAYLWKWLSDRENINSEEKTNLKEKIKIELNKLAINNPENIFNYTWTNFICPLFEDIWIKNKSAKLIYEHDAYDKKGRVKKEFNNSEYLEKIRKREKVIKEIQDKCREEIKRILNKKEGVEKFEYDDIEKLIKLANSSDVSNTLKELVNQLKKVQEDLIDFLKKEWETNVISEQKLDKEKSLFYRLPLDSGFYKNFLFFNNSKGYLEQKESFYNLICFNSDKEDLLKIIDKTINKLLPSEDEFPNINYTKFSTELLRKQLKYPFVYLLCFVYAFENYKNIGNVFFYSSDLKFSYFINKKLKKYKKNIENSKDPNIIFKVTWRQIIDTLVEHKSSWTLENMYIVSYQRLDNQAQEGVEYIGVPKLQASVLLDDRLRNALNKSIQFRSKNFKGEKYCWLLKEFIKGKPLYPIILNHMWLAINKEVNPQITTSLYALSVDANVKKLNRSRGLFSDDFFEDRYREIVNAIKKNYSYMSLAKNLIKDIFPEKNERESLSYELFAALKGKDKSAFLNILLKNLNAKSNENKIYKSKVDLLEYNYFNLLEDDVTWENFALPLVIGLLGVDENGQGDENE